MKNAMEGFMKEMEQVMKSMDPSEMKNMSFETMFSSIGRAMDNHLKPLMFKYKGREKELLQGFVQQTAREDMLRDQKLLREIPEAQVSNPVKALKEALANGQQNKYDRVLQRELRSGKEIAEIRKEYETAKGENETDKQGILNAIDRHLAKGQKVQKRLMLPSVRDTLPNGVTFSVDAKDGDIVMHITKEKMEAFIKQSPDARMLPNGDIEFTANNIPYQVRHDKQEDAYEIVL